MDCSRQSLNCVAIINAERKIVMQRIAYIMLMLALPAMAQTDTGKETELMKKNATGSKGRNITNSAGKTKTIIRVAAPCRPMRPAVIMFKFPG